LEEVVGWIALAFLWGCVCFTVGWRLSARYRAPWLVRPHTRRTIDRMPLPENTPTTVSDSVFVRSNLPNSDSTME
jgi:hypothetical protein